MSEHDDATHAMVEGADQPRAARLDAVTKLAIVRVHQAQKDTSAAELAVMFGVSESTVRRVLAVHAADCKETVQTIMRAGATTAVEAWETAMTVAASKGFHQPSRDWLVAIDAVEAKPTVGVNVDARPTIVLNMPFTLGALKDYKPEAQAIEATTTIEATRVEAPSLPPSKGSGT